MKFYSKKNNSNYALGTAESDTKIHSGLNEHCSIKLSDVGFAHDPADSSLFIKYDGYSDNKLIKSDGSVFYPGSWGTTASSCEYYCNTTASQFLAGRTNCPIPNRSGALNTWTNAGPSGFKHFVEIPYDLSSFTDIKISYNVSTKTISATGGTSFTAPVGNSTMIIDIQAPGGHGGYGEGRMGVLNIGGGNTGGGGGGGGGFATIIVDMLELTSFTIKANTNNMSIWFDDGVGNFLGVYRGNTGGSGSFSGGSAIYGAGATGGNGGTGGKASFTARSGVYLLDSVTGSSGGKGEATIWVSSDQWAGAAGSSLTHSFAPGPLKTSLSQTCSGGSYSNSSNKYTYCNGGGGGASACSSGGQGGYYYYNVDRHAIKISDPSGYGSGGGGGVGYLCGSGAGSPSGSAGTWGTRGAPGGIVFYI